MFRNPRTDTSESMKLASTPAIGRPPTPPSGMTKPKNSPPLAMPLAEKSKTTLNGAASAKRTFNTTPPRSNTKLKGKSNGSILSYFKKADSQPVANDSDGLFVQGGQDNGNISLQGSPSPEKSLQSLSRAGDVIRYNENSIPIKRQKTEASSSSVTTELPPGSETPAVARAKERSSKPRRGPFLEDSESEEENTGVGNLDLVEAQTDLLKMDARTPPPTLKRESTSYFDDGFDSMGDFVEDLYGEGDEYTERRWVKEQARLEMAENGIFCEDDDDDVEGTVALSKIEEAESNAGAGGCPICNMSLVSMSNEEATRHVNHCLDGDPVSVKSEKQEDDPPMKEISALNRFRRPVWPAKPGQADPYASTKSGNASAFSKMMSSNAEDTAWAIAAAAEQEARGKPAYQRTCPFYKILTGFSICVDAFRYGAVEGCNAYFLSHFHSDHYIGLTSTWQHGPIYCSRVTANLVRQQLRVDPKWVVDLEFEKGFEVPGTGARVTMIPANHCPGSSIFLFEKGKTRILHCGDFRACPEHINHSLLRPVNDGKQQKINICYLDTTYLNPRYAFPSQEEVISACAEACINLTNGTDDFTKTGNGMIKFVKSDANAKEPPGRLLVVVGTYSIGKERICVGIAKALKSKIYAPGPKQRICACLEDPELDALLTRDPQEAQVHMTPLFEIRAETLHEYLTAYKPHFSRVVGFRPSGWNYRPPGSRADLPVVQTVLNSDNWKSHYSVGNLEPQRGSTREANCFGVPYSEHSSFRELTMFVCALRIDKIIPTVNVGSAKSREKMKAWCERWAMDKKKNGLYKWE